MPVWRFYWPSLRAQPVNDPPSLFADAKDCSTYRGVVPVAVGRMDKRESKMQELNKVGLSVAGMTCPSCTKHVEDALLAVPGVTAASVDYPTNRAQITGNRLDMSALVTAVGGTWLSCYACRRSRKQREQYRTAGTSWQSRPVAERRPTGGKASRSAPCGDYRYRWRRCGSCAESG